MYILGATQSYKIDLQDKVCTPFIYCILATCLDDVEYPIKSMPKTHTIWHEVLDFLFCNQLFEILNCSLDCDLRY